MSSSKQDNVVKEKDVALYSAMVDAWISSRMEKDRSIFYIASSGIGLLITLGISGVPVTRWEFVFYVVALLLFLVTILLVLWVFHRNPIYLESVIFPKPKNEEAKEKDADENDGILGILDIIIPITFCLAILFSLCIAFNVLNRKSLEKEEYMSQKETRPLRESINGIARLQPQGETRSLNGIANLRPAAPPVPPAKPAAPKPTVNNTPKKD